VPIHFLRVTLVAPPFNLGAATDRMPFAPDIRRRGYVQEKSRRPWGGKSQISQSIDGRQRR
jgi:hypothetical protein